MNSRFVVTCFCLFAAVNSGLGDDKLKYPESKTIDQFDDLHGVRVADPYRWLETDVRESKDVEQWVTAQNQVTFEYLASLPQRESIKNGSRNFGISRNSALHLKRVDVTSISKTMACRTNPCFTNKIHWNPNRPF